MVFKYDILVCCSCHMINLLSLVHILSYIPSIWVSHSCTKSSFPNLYILQNLMKASLITNEISAVMGALVVASGNCWESKPEEHLGPRAAQGTCQAISPGPAPDHGMAWPEARLGPRAAHKVSHARSLPNPMLRTAPPWIHLFTNVCPFSEGNHRLLYCQRGISISLCCNVQTVAVQASQAKPKDAFISTVVTFFVCTRDWIQWKIYLAKSWFADLMCSAELLET